MVELEATSGRFLSVWWLIIWRFLLGALVLGAIVGVMIGLVGAMSGSPAEDIALASTLSSIPLGLGWSWVVVKMALRKKYGDFRLAFVANEPAPTRKRK